MLGQVKTVSLFLMILTVGIFGGCTIAEEDASGVGNRLQEGLQGRGKIVPNDPMNDSFGPEYQ